MKKLRDEKGRILRYVDGLGDDKLDQLKKDCSICKRLRRNRSRAECPFHSKVKRRFGSGITRRRWKQRYND